MVSPKASSEELIGVHDALPTKARPVFRRVWKYMLGITFSLTVVYLLNSSHTTSILAKPLRPSEHPQTSLDTWIQNEEQISYEQIYHNLGGGLRAKDAAPGAVIASPSTEEPNYYYQWVRDAAIIYKVIIGQFLAGNNTLEPLIKQWAESQDAIQHTQNPSGEYHSGGLGEPKFMVDNSPYSGSWGRPQDDGPAIRATALIAYANHLLTTEPGAKSIDLLYKSTYPADSVIKADLEYVSHNWQQDSFDLWEEVEGFHFFTLIVQLRSMLEGAAFAKTMSDHDAAIWYSKQADAMRSRLAEFWTDEGWIRSTLVRDSQRPRTGLDCGTILGSLHGYSSLQPEYSPASDKMLSTHYNYVRSMKALYKINQDAKIPGVACGRYPEDVYDGYHKSLGNPWYLCTTAAAEQMYKAADILEAAQNITISKTSLSFFKQFVTSVQSDHIYRPESSEYKEVLTGMRSYGDSFMATVRHFAQPNGSLSEQFNRDTGAFQGARDLTWSYGAFITSTQARRSDVTF